MKMKKLLFLTAAAAMLAGCGETEELAQRQDQQSDAEKGGIDLPSMPTATPEPDSRAR